ncbi:hypothetical protein RCL_jg29171.t1 [Rhizophagus clarus]|uniref:Uncharacterized protein n=1 Tax=Rhizophagus clarus TaxID=94130 RepID=A0A8H3R0M1_9GLOM|nr:hypothetical protein RCL_jg29171.t1 [Rhizophagus clarus]
MSSQYRNKPIQEQEIRKKNSLIKIWKPLQPQSQQPLWRYRHDIFAINYGDEVTISNQHYNNIITEIDTIMT